MGYAGYVGDPTTSTYRNRQLPPLRLDYASVSVHDTVAIAGDDASANVPAGVDGTNWRWTDLDSEGLQGVLSEDAGAWYYKRNVSAWSPAGSPPVARFEPLELIALQPVGSTGARTTQLVDLHGDGHLCAVEMAPPA